MEVYVLMNYYVNGNDADEQEFDSEVELVCVRANKLDAMKQSICSNLIMNHLFFYFLIPII